MKTFSRFQRDLQEAIPLAIGAGLALPMIGAGVKLVQGYLQAKKQGQGGRSQPVDYGQSGEGAKPRKPPVQRPSGKITAAQAQQRQARLDRKDQVQADQEEAAKQGIERLLGSDKDRVAAAQARANPEAQRSAALKRTISQRMSQAADRLGL